MGAAARDLWGDGPGREAVYITADEGSSEVLVWQVNNPGEIGFTAHLIIG